MSSIERRVASGILAEPSVTRTAGKGLALGGFGAIGLSVLAGFIPFVGVLGLGVIMAVLGTFLFFFSE